MEDPLASVALAISGYRSDAPVLALLRSVFAAGQAPFGTVIVVDSLGSGAIAAAIAANAWPVAYIDADRNLGSAGNLALRLETAAATGASWCYAVNHDGLVEPDQVRKLVAHGVSRPRVGAVYPTLIYSNRGNRVESPRRTLTTLASFESEPPPREAVCEDVAWSSSNCALYSLDAVREGVEVWSDLWMGWEDLALGWLLAKKGWVQLQCRDVVVVDSYEYHAARLFGRTLYIASKPNWYAYYQMRNLVLIARRSGGEACTPFQLLRRMAVGAGGRLLVPRPGRAAWFGNFLKGIMAGMKGVTGKGPVP
ncbi:MAG: glycosyltransferase family 2 protein [Allosphingosinicella sp.]